MVASSRDAFCVERLGAGEQCLVEDASGGGFGENADGEAWMGLVGPMITYLLPLLIGYTGGRMVHGQRGGVVGAIATVGVIVGAPGTPMFLGAMAIAPAAAWLIKKIDQLVQDKTVMAVLTTSMHGADTARVAQFPNVEYLTKPLTAEKMQKLMLKRFQ